MILSKKGARAGAVCDHHKMKVRTRVRAHWNLDVRVACKRRKNRSQPMPCLLGRATCILSSFYTQISQEGIQHTYSKVRMVAIIFEKKYTIFFAPKVASNRSSWAVFSKTNRPKISSNLRFYSLKMREQLRSYCSNIYTVSQGFQRLHPNFLRNESTKCDRYHRWWTWMR